MIKFKVSEKTEETKPDVTKNVQRERSSVDVLWEKLRDKSSDLEDEGFDIDGKIFDIICQVIRNLEVMSLDDLERIQKDVQVIKNEWFAVRKEQEKAELKAINDTFKEAKKHINNRIVRVTKSLAQNKE